MAEPVAEATAAALRLIADGRFQIGRLFLPADAAGAGRLRAENNLRDNDAWRGARFTPGW